MAARIQFRAAASCHVNMTDVRKRVRLPLFHAGQPFPGAYRQSGNVGAQHGMDGVQAGAQYPGDLCRVSQHSSRSSQRRSGSGEEQTKHLSGMHNNFRPKKGKQPGALRAVIHL